tara:strand:- start:6955 stop:8094 length:1140 start_codon:yes stop_codon:yes gene_type:complete
MKIKCELCGEECHSIKAHLEESHEEWTVAEYKTRHPGAPLFSKDAIDQIKKMKMKKEASEMAATPTKSTRRALHEVFDISSGTPGALNKKGQPIPIVVLGVSANDFAQELVPDLDDNYIFNMEYLKTCVMGLESNIPAYTVGMAGTGKSTLWEQICARTQRPMLRVQHTGNSEESHVLGQYLVKDGSTYWEPGPLQLCMKYGITYLADEYDRAMPQVLSVYQPVLEGKQLVTKEAPPEWRIIKPHPDFRFVATGNTNGAGDETGLFPSTMLQDFANYERFGIMIKIDWMPQDQETAIVAGQSSIPEEDARQLVLFATEVRKQVDGGQITAPISPRALINAASIGIKFRDYAKGLELAYMNRLGQSDAEACRQVAQRYFK